MPKGGKRLNSGRKKDPSQQVRLKVNLINKINKLDIKTDIFSDKVHMLYESYIKDDS